MSVKRKFRKSKKGKGKSKSESKGKNNKYNNEKRSKIQRKTKKRVLRGGRITGIRIKGSPLPISLKKCQEWFDEVKRVYPSGIPSDELVERTQGKTDFDYCEKKVSSQNTEYQVPEVSPPSTPKPEPEQPIITETDEEKKSQQIQEANDQVAEDSDVQTEEIPNDSAATLRLYEQHDKLAQKYLELEATEQDPEIKKIYRKAKEYHYRINAKLWLILQKREEIEQSDTSVVENNDSEANVTNVTNGPGLVLLKFDDDDDESAESHIVDNLKLFPRACFDKSGKCIDELNAANNQSLFCYQYLTIIILTFIKDSKKIDFKNLLSFHKPVFDSKLVDAYLKFFNFYNEHMSAGDEKKKFIVKTNPTNRNILLDGNIIFMEQYPDIDLITFLRNCYKLYKLSLPIVCSYRLAYLAYNNEDIGEDITHGNVNQIASQIANKTPTNFSPTNLDERNLQKIIDILEKKFKEYSSPGSGERSESVLSDLRKYNPILSSLVDDFSSSILPIPPALPPAQYQDQSQNQPHEQTQSLLEILKFIDEYLISPTTTITCVQYDVSGGSKTRADIRDKLEKTLKDYMDKISNVIANEDIFKTGCRFIAGRPKIKEAIIKLIDENNTQIDSKSEFEKNCSEKSKKFLEEANDPTNNFKTDIFFHMIIYACYMTSIAPKTTFTIIEKPSKWGKQGTDLMILYMNEFVARFFIKILDQAIRFYQRLNANMPSTPVILMDNNTFFLFILLDAIKENIFKLGIKQKMQVPILQQHYEDFILVNFEQLKFVQHEIEEKIKKNNSDQSEFIERLNFKPEKESSRLQKMYEEGDLKQEMANSCMKLRTEVEKVYDREYPEKRKVWEKTKPVQEKKTLTSNTPTLKEFSPTAKVNYTSEDKDACKQFVVTDMIMYARELKNINAQLNSVFLGDDYLNKLNTCCDPNDVFGKGLNSREHLKRITRAYYGLSELWPYIITKHQQAILKLPGVNGLIEKFKNDSSFKTKVENQCNDDGKRESKLLGRIWRSKHREDIIANINPDHLPQICYADVTNSELNSVLTEPELQPVVEPVVKPVVEPVIETKQETLEQLKARLNVEASTKRAEDAFAKDLVEAAAKIAKEPTPYVLTPEEQENNLLWRALANLDIINDPDNAAHVYSVRDAQEAINLFKTRHPAIYLKAELIKRTGAVRPKWIPEEELARRFAESRQVKDQLVKGRIEPPTNKSLWQIITGTGGTTSTKNRTKHKPNHKAKAKTQSKPKHKNKSKTKPKPKHRSKTIKKNKRAHHKFDKKYTRKR